MKRVLLTGAKGNLGRPLERELLKCGLCVISCDHESLDVTNEQELISAFAAAAPDLVLNAAGFTDMDEAELNEELCMAVNFRSVQLLAKLCREQGIPLMQLSCDCVFDTLLSRAHLEDDETHASSVYGRSKILAESAVRRSLCRSMIVRCGMIFGGGSAADSLRRLMNAAREGRELTAISDEIISPTPCTALAQALSKLCLMMLEDDNIHGIVHFAGTPAVSHAQFVRTVLLKAAGLELLQSLPPIRELRSCARTETALRPLDPSLDLTATERNYGLTMPKWEELLEQALLQEVSNPGDVQDIGKVDDEKI